MQNTIVRDKQTIDDVGTIVSKQAEIPADGIQRQIILTPTPAHGVRVYDLVLPMDRLADLRDGR